VRPRTKSRARDALEDLTLLDFHVHGQQTTDYEGYPKLLAQTTRARQASPLREAVGPDEGEARPRPQREALDPDEGEARLAPMPVS
jgi:hypothetical protein